MREAAAYYRTSSAANVGEDKDSLKRQRSAVQAYAAANDIRIVREAYDSIVSGTDPIDQRRGILELLSETDGPKIILVENADRFARKLVVQEAGSEWLKQLGYQLISVDSPSLFADGSPQDDFYRQMRGALAQLEKGQLMLRLRAARERKRAEQGKCEGRKSYQELDPALIREAKRLRRRSPSTGKRRSLRQISQELFDMGYATKNGTPFGAGQIQRLVS